MSKTKTEFQDGINIVEVGTFPYAERCDCGSTLTGWADTQDRCDKSVAMFWMMHSYRDGCGRIVEETK